ncbi:MAG: tetratricopeptide repeat protein, partial [Vicinamibacteria bacterium]
ALEHDRAAEGLSPAKKAVSLAPDAVWSRYALGRVLAATGSAGEAVAQLERADALKPEDPDVLLALAQAYGQAGRPGDVERVRAKLLTLPALREPHLVR